VPEQCHALDLFCAFPLPLPPLSPSAPLCVPQRLPAPHHHHHCPACSLQCPNPDAASAEGPLISPALQPTA